MDGRTAQDGAVKHSQDDIFPNTDQLGPALFYSTSCLISFSHNKAYSNDWIPPKHPNGSTPRFDELTTQTSFSKLADIKYTWSLPSTFLCQASGGPRSYTWLTRKVHKQRALLFVCLGPLYQGEKQTESKNHRYCNTKWHKNDQRKPWNSQWRFEKAEKKILHAVGWPVGFTLFYYAPRSLYLS